jgi:predicted amidohydrolase
VDDLLQKLDRLGELGCDIACTYEFVWIHGQNETQTQQAKASLARIAEKAKQHQMYVLVAGVVDRIERNEAILFDRDGREVGRYFKIAKTHDEQIPGEETPVLETDFGKIGVRICADEWMVELDRAYALKGAEMIFTPTQSWGPDALFRDLRDISRAMDTGMYLVEATHQCTEVRHRSMIVDPAGVVIARSAYNRAGIVYADIDLDNKPLRYVRDWTPHEPGGYLPQYQPDRLPKAMNDLQETILRQRRPELYQALAPEAK